MAILTYKRQVAAELDWPACRCHSPCPAAHGKLRQHFDQHVSEMEQAEYEEQLLAALKFDAFQLVPLTIIEGISWEGIGFRNSQARVQGRAAYLQHRIRHLASPSGPWLLG